MTSRGRYYGFFQQFRPHGLGVERVFDGVPDGDRYVTRLLEIYRATNDETCAKDAYFIVRNPIAATGSELRDVGREFILNLRVLAESIGNPELSEYLARLTRVQLTETSRLNGLHDENLLVLETIGDWLLMQAKAGDLVAEMRDAFYTVACDFFLSHYLQWPYYADRDGIDVFRPYFELWRRGASVSFEDGVLLVGQDDDSKALP